MSGVRALLASLFQPAMLFAHLYQSIQQERLCLFLYQTRAKSRQQRVIKAGIREVQSESIFTVNALASRIGRLSISEILAVLQHGHQSQSPRRICRLARDRIARGKLRVLIQFWFWDIF